VSRSGDRRRKRRAATRTDKDVKVTRRRRALATQLGWREEKGRRIKNQKSAPKTRKRAFIWPVHVQSKFIGMQVIAAKKRNLQAKT
jgi:hypothetical protein